MNLKDFLLLFVFVALGVLMREAARRGRWGR
jgi:hypothetical protein